MNENKKIARIAGVWYLCIAVFYTIGMIYGDKAFYVPGDATSTINNILSSEWMFRLAIVSTLIGHVCFLFLVNALYKLFKPVNENWARMMVLFVVVGVSISSISCVNQFVSILLLNGSEYLSTVETTHLNALAILFLDIYKYGANVAVIFWGLWLLPLGLLIFKSGIIPKILGALLIITCFSYLVDFTLFYFLPKWIPVVDPVQTAIQVGSEVSFLFWLLVKGAKESDCGKIAGS